MKNTLNVGLEGRYKFIAIKPDGTERELTGWCENLVLDAGLNRLGTAGIMSQCQVGSGSTTPAVGQTALVSLIGTTSTVQSTNSGSNTPTNTYAWLQRTFRFAAGVATGNISEVGVGWSGGLFSRALVTDGGGTPTTITVLSDEVLDVLYEIRMYPNLSDQTFNVTIAGVAYTFTARPVNLGTGWPFRLSMTTSNGIVDASATNAGAYGSMVPYAAGASLAAITASAMTGTALMLYTQSGNVASFVGSYVNNSNQRTLRNSFGLSAGSVPFAGFVVTTGVGDYQMTVSPSIPKDSTKTLSLDYTISWARKTI